MKREYDRKVEHLRRLAQVADGMYKTSERENVLKESENASAKLRQKFQQHMRECDEKEERCKQTDTENTMVTQNTSIKISFINCREEFSAKEFCISNDLHVKNLISGLGTTVFYDFYISKREDKDTYAGKVGRDTRGWQS